MGRSGRVPEPAFVVEGVRVRLGATQALERVDLRIDEGEALALVGPSGAGKTTLLGLLNGAVEPTEGRVLVRGQDFARLDEAQRSALRAHIGVVPQGLSLVPNVRVAHNVLAGALGRQGFWAGLKSLYWPAPSERAEVHRLLERVGIGDKLYQRTDTLSGGEEQRVAIARALYQEPQALLADEPISRVDPARSEELIRLFAELSRERGIPLCVSLHDLALARAHFPRLVGMRAGRVVFDGPPDSIDEATYKALYTLDEA